MRVTVHEFRTKQEADGFAAGVEFVNDSTIEVDRVENMAPGRWEVETWDRSVEENEFFRQELPVATRPPGAETDPVEVLDVDGDKLTAWHATSSGHLMVRFTGPYDRTKTLAFLDKDVLREWARGLAELCDEVKEGEE